jgi:hypothetical protein
MDYDCTLKNNGIIMICGSLAIQMVLEILETICQKIMVKVYLSINPQKPSIVGLLLKKIPNSIVNIKFGIYF